METRTFNEFSIALKVYSRIDYMHPTAYKTPVQKPSFVVLVDKKISMLVPALRDVIIWAYETGYMYFVCPVINYASGIAFQTGTYYCFHIITWRQYGCVDQPRWTQEEPFTIKWIFLKFGTDVSWPVSTVPNSF